MTEECLCTADWRVVATDGVVRFKVGWALSDWRRYDTHWSVQCLLPFRDTIKQRGAVEKKNGLAEKAGEKKCPGIEFIRKCFDL
jgi:hypothetical protein